MLVVELEFALQDLVIADGVAFGVFGEFEHVEKHMGALDVAKEADTESCSLVSAFDQAGYIGHDKGVSSRGLDDAEVGRECCEGVFRDLGFGFGNVSDQGGFADVGKAENTDICEQFEFQSKSEMLAGFAGFGKVGGLACGGNKVDIAAPTASPGGDAKRLVVIDEIDDQFARFFVVYEGSRGDTQERVEATASVLISSAPMFAALGLIARGIAKVEQGGEVVIGAQDHIASLSSVAT